MSGGFYVTWGFLLGVIFLGLPAALGYLCLLSAAAQAIARRRKLGK